MDQIVTSWKDSVNAENFQILLISSLQYTPTNLHSTSLTHIYDNYTKTNL